MSNKSLSSKVPSWTGVTFKAMLTPDGEPYIEGLTYRSYPGYKFQGNGTLTHPLHIVPVLENPVTPAKQLSLRHPDDAAIAENALNQFQRVLAGDIKPLHQKKALTTIYATLSAVHIAPRLEGERVCVHCGCTDSHACRGGCSWAVLHKATPTGVCSQCVPKEIKIIDSL